MKTDEYGLVVCDDGDGGDTARNEWSYYLAGRKSLAPLKLFSENFTVLVRHPKPNIFWSDPKTTSRDQTLHAFTYLAQWPDYFRNFHRAHRKRFYLCQNNDLLWANLNVIFRASNLWWLWPFTVFFDISLLFGALERCHVLPRWDHDRRRPTWRNDQDDVGDDLNLQMCFVQPNHPSPVRYLARLIYKYFRPKTYGNNMPDCVNNAHGCWLWYYRHDERNHFWPPALWAEICRKYF